jgi:hypothetical protein
MKKIVILLVLVAGLATLVYQSMQNATLSNMERQQARVLLAEDIRPGGGTGEDSFRPRSSGYGSTATVAKPGCRSTLACNYDSTATMDGGTCEYAFWSNPRNSDNVTLFPDSFYHNVDQGVTISKFLNASVFESKNSTDPAELSVKVIPKRSCSTSGCVALSVVRFSLPAGTVFLDIQNVNFKPVIETKGWVSQNTATLVTGMKACDQRPTTPTPATKKLITPTNPKR